MPSNTQSHIDIEEHAHLQDYPVRLATYRGSHWSGNEGKADIVDPKEAHVEYVEREPLQLGYEDADIAGNRFRVRHIQRTILARTDNLEFISGKGSDDVEMEFAERRQSSRHLIIVED